MPLNHFTVDVFPKTQPCQGRRHLRCGVWVESLEPVLERN